MASKTVGHEPNSCGRPSSIKVDFRRGPEGFDPDFNRNEGEARGRRAAVNSDGSTGYDDGDDDDG